MKPAVSILNQAFEYRNANNTDIRDTFAQQGMMMPTKQAKQANRARLEMGVELHKAERRAEQAIDLLERLYRAACGSPHLQHQHPDLQREVQTFLHDFSPARVHGKKRAA